MHIFQFLWKEIQGNLFASVGQEFCTMHIFQFLWKEIQGNLFASVGQEFCTVHLPLLTNIHRIAKSANDAG